MWWSKHSLLRTALIGCTLATASVVAGCGFQPMYARSNNGDTLKTALAAVDVAVIEDRIGQMLRNALERRFEQGAGNGVQKRFRLVVELSEDKVASAFRKDATNTRETLTLRAVSTLEMGGKVIWRRPDSVVTAYNITPDHFSVEMAARDARERGIEQLANQITDSVAIFLKQNPNPTPLTTGTRP